MDQNFRETWQSELVVTNILSISHTIFQVEPNLKRLPTLRRAMSLLMRCKPFLEILAGLFAKIAR